PPWRWRQAWPATAAPAASAMEAMALALPGPPEPPVTRYGLGLFAYAQSLDLAKARRLLGWTPKVGFEQGLDRTFAGGGLA
ncbi:NAD(P)-dependent oxidoreductase, partial [Mesorhizobium sp. M4A.F.Ca.ET.020.02.1.1]